MKTGMIEWWVAIAEWAEGPEELGTALSENQAWDIINNRGKHFGDPIHGFQVKRRTMSGNLIAAVEQK